ncbi:MAG: cyanophycin synthetase [Acidimicrobiales bacterium]
MADDDRGQGAKGRVLVVFGCGGDRDPSKRALMGEVAGAGADQVIITTDNPRSEDPHSITEAVRAGVSDRVAPIVEPDRALAIGQAVAVARPGDVVVIAGKGHETTQIVGTTARPFVDGDVARAAIRGLDR